MAIRGLTELNGLEKASVLLMALGASASAEVFKHLTEQEIEVLTSEIVRTRQVDSGIRDVVLGEFEHACAARGSSGSGGKEFAARVLEQALGQDKASDLIEKAATPLRARPFESLRDADAIRIAELLGGEHPQVVALVLASLPPEKAASVLSKLDASLQADTALRICTTDQIDPGVLGAIEEALSAKLTSVDKRTARVSAGPQVLVDILNHVDRQTERLVLEALRSRDESVGGRIRAMMFVFGDITRLDSKTVQLVLREIDYEDLKLALKGSSDAIKEFIFNNMSEHAAGALKDDVELLGRVRTRDIEAAQQRVARVVRRLLASGKAVVEEPDSELRLEGEVRD